MIEPEDVYNAMCAALADNDKRREENAPAVAPGMIAIAPFDAEDTDEKPVRVVGVVTNPGFDMLEFVVIRTREDGEMFPAAEASVWPAKHNI